MLPGSPRSAAGLRLAVLLVAATGLATAPACNGGGPQPTPLPTPTTRPRVTPRPTPSPTEAPATPTPTPALPTLRGRLRAELTYLADDGLASDDGRSRLGGATSFSMTARGEGIRLDGAYVRLPGLRDADFNGAMRETVGTRYRLRQATSQTTVGPVAGMVVAAFSLETGALVMARGERTPFAITGADGTFVLPLPEGDLGPLLLVARPAVKAPASPDDLAGLAEAEVVPEPLRMAFGAIARVAGREILLDEETRVTTLYLRARARATVEAAWRADPAARAALLRLTPSARQALLRRAGDRLLAASALAAAPAAGASPGPAVAFGAALAGLRAAADKAVATDPTVLLRAPWPTPAAALPPPDPLATPASAPTPVPEPTPWSFTRTPGSVDVIDQVALGWLAAGAPPTDALATLGASLQGPLLAAAQQLDAALVAALPGVQVALRESLDAAAGPAPSPTPIKLGATPRPSPSN